MRAALVGMATLRSTAIGYHRTNGDANIARATRRADRRSDNLIQAVTSSYPNMQ
ncbi:MAG TPA: hypothetical protein VFX60_19000 [Micromonospora sp.]|nr:hypothetical protein [Micromonospora sp.]